MGNRIADTMAGFIGDNCAQKEQKPVGKMDFMEAVEHTLQELPYNVSVTENGAIGYKSSGKRLVDINFAVSSLRNKNEHEIENMFEWAYNENPLYAWKWLFYLRDCREGMGERRSFRIILQYMANSKPKETAAMLPYIAEYGRYDDMWVLLDTPLKQLVIEMVAHQLAADIEACETDKPMSLLAKWMPNRTSSNEKTKHYAKIFIDEWRIHRRTYKKTLSKLRRKLDIVETKMSQNQWDAIDYNKVPSRANLLYKDAFMRHDAGRRTAFLEALDRGDSDVKINAGVLFPHDIVHQYGEGRTVDKSLEALWKAQQDTVNGATNVMVVADGSGSMEWSKAGYNSKISCLTVANALAIYFAERSSGQFKDKYITFSCHPRLVDLSKACTLRDKINTALRYNECADTNIEKVLELILNTAIANKMNQDDMPNTILILSDMEFNVGTSGRTDITLFQEFEQKFKEHGYKLPRLAFWNICSRTGTIPVKENESGVALISGFSPAVVKMVLSDKLDPYECLLEQLNTERYQAIEDAFWMVKGA